MPEPNNAKVPGSGVGVEQQSDHVQVSVAKSMLPGAWPLDTTISVILENGNTT